MNSYNNKLNPLFVLLCLACCVALFPDAASLGPIGKVGSGIGKVGPGIGKVGHGVNKVLGKEPLEKMYNANDLVGKATDHMDCSSVFCPKFRNYPADHPCAGCTVKTLTHP